jgi:molybdate transport system regulatory protein
MGVDYRCAWDKLDEMESGLGATLVERQVGGAGGGGARLTPEGLAFVNRFVMLIDVFEGVMTKEGQTSFGSNVVRILAPPGHDAAQTPCGTPALEET